MERPEFHFRAAWQKRSKLYVHCWIRSLDGLKPEIVVLDRASSEDELNRLEIENIAHFSILGCRLTNLTEGGEGVSGYRHTEETRALLSRQQLGTRRPQTSGDRHWLRRTGRPSPMKGRELPQSARDTLSEKLTGKRYPDRKGQAVLEVNSGLEFGQAAQAAKHFGVSKSTVSRCVSDGIERQGLLFRRFD